MLKKAFILIVVFSTSVSTLLSEAIYSKESEDITARIEHLMNEITKMESDRGQLLQLKAEQEALKAAEEERIRGLRSLAGKTAQHRMLLQESFFQYTDEQSVEREEVQTLLDKNSELDARIQRQIRVSSSAISSAEKNIRQLEEGISAGNAMITRYTRDIETLTAELDRRGSQAELIGSYSSMMETLIRESETLLAK